MMLRWEWPHSGPVGGGIDGVRAEPESIKCAGPYSWQVLHSKTSMWWQPLHAFFAVSSMVSSECML